VKKSPNNNNEEDSLEISAEISTNKISQLQFISQNLLFATIINLLAAGALIFVVQHQVAQLNLLVWFSLMLAVTIARIFVVSQFKKSLSLIKSGELKSYTIVMALTAGVWGMAPWIIFPENSILAQVLLAMMLIFLISISALALSGSFTDVFYYTILVATPFFIKYIYVGTAETVMIALAMLFFSCITLLNAYRVSKNYSDQLELHNKLRNKSHNLKKIERELTLIFNVSSSVLLLLDLEGRILRVNRKALEVVDLPLTINVRDFKIWDPPWWKQDAISQNKIKEDFNQALNGAKATRLVEVLNSNGKLLTHQISFSPIYYKDNINYIYVEGMDITKQIDIQKMLEFNESKFRELSDTAGECLWEIDANAIYQKIDERSLIVKGFSPIELIGNHFALNMPVEDRNKFETYFSKAKESRVSFQVELRSQAKSGELLWEKITATPIITNSNHLVGYRGSSISVTEAKSQETVLIKAKEDAEAGTRAKSQFLAIMSHEIRTPMNGVIGMAELLLETKLNSKQKEYVSTIVSSGYSLLQLLNDILDLSKIESNKFELERSSFDLRKLVCDAAELMAASKPNNPVELLVNMDRNVPQFVTGDSTRLRQVLMNLLGNSVKFTKKGSIILEVSTIKLTQLNVDLEIKIIDTGIGIPADKLEHIFNNFSQADASTTRNFGGTGLGLAVSRQIIELMGGEIGVESHEGGGSVFTVSINYPLAESSSIEDTNEIKIQNINERNILLVEDNLVNQKIAISLLQNIGYSVALALNGNEAVNQCDNSKFDAILMDCQMPLMDGYEATVAIRAGVSENNSTPIIAMTANVMSGDREKCLDVGMNDYLPKPINNISLKSILEKHIN
jgi:PAS domain S-box-containing protein